MTPASTHPAHAAIRVDAPCPVIRFDEIDSTSAHAQREIHAGRLAPLPVAFAAITQTAGIGRFGRAWVSPAGGLWVTLAWPTTEVQLDRTLDGLGLRVGVACLRTIRRAFEGTSTDPFVRLKWPNDVLIKGRKVLGVLTEVVHGPAPGSRPWLVMGVGVNANLDLAALPEELRSQATTLAAELGRAVDLRALETDLLEELRKAVNDSGLDREVIREAAKYLHGLERDAIVSMPDGSKVAGVLKGLNDHGMAVLDVDGRMFVPPLGSVIMNDQPGR
jgi:BirA family biotin operon repressor/biotin-[acetyl-CoA-carboxylase] ligase